MDTQLPESAVPANGRVRLSWQQQPGAVIEREFDFGTLTFAQGEKLSPKVAQVLWCLLQQPEQTVAKEALLDSVWAGQARVPDVLVQAIADIRRGLGEPLRQQLRTVPKHGYRLELQVQWLDNSAALQLAQPGEPTQRSSSSTFGSNPLRWLALIGLLVLALWFAGRDMAPTQSSSTAELGQTEWRLGIGERLSFEPGADRQPALNPQGNLLAYVRPSKDAGPYKIFLRQFGSAAAPRQLSADDAAIELQPAWSTRGDRLAWLRFADGGCHFVIHQLTDGSKREFGDCFNDIAPPLAWTADDRALLITDRIESAQRALHLVLLDLDSGQRRMLDYPRAERQADYQPRLSADRQYWAFLRSAPQATELWRMRVDGSESQRVARFPAGLSGYDWLADGSGWLVSDASEPVRQWWLVDRGGALQALHAPNLQQPRRAAEVDRWVAEEPPSPGRLWRHLGGHSGPLAASETGSDEYPTAHPTGGLLFVSSRRGRSELWWQGASGEPRPLGDSADQFARPAWWGADAFLVAVRQGATWQLQRRRLDDGDSEVLDLGRYRVSDLAAVDGHWFAIGSLLASEDKSELLRLRFDGDKVQAESTGIAAIALRGGSGQLWIRQYLQRGVRQVDPLSLKLGDPVGSVHFIDWQVDDGGLLYWRRRDLLNHELVWQDPSGRLAERIELAADEAFDPSAGLTRSADGALICIRRDSDAGDLHAIELQKTP